MFIHKFIYYITINEPLVIVVVIVIVNNIVYMKIWTIRVLQERLYKRGCSQDFFLTNFSKVNILFKYVDCNQLPVYS